MKSSRGSIKRRMRTLLWPMIPTMSPTETASGKATLTSATVIAVFSQKPVTRM